MEHVEMTTINAHPLAWPVGWKRTQSYARKGARFKTTMRTSGGRAQFLTISEATLRVLAELERMGYGRDDIVISTNVALRLDGLPRSDQREPSDPGAAVYWRAKKGDNKVMAIDAYDTVAGNLGAIAATLDAMRAIERHGGATILDRAFTGFTALPSPEQASEWWTVLGVPQNATPAEIDAAYRRAASVNHPDRGGSHEAMARLNIAVSAARAARV